jgi:hypothetical protein
MNATVNDQAAGFDFIIGRWSVTNRRLRERLAGSAQWDEFLTISTARSLWGGPGNVDEIVGTSATGPVLGVTLRLFDPSLGLWRLYWATPSQGVVEAPMVGRFEGGRGVFYNHEVHRDRGVIVRFIYSDITATSCRWQQAFSVDGGTSWEINWYMDFRRID